MCQRETFVFRCRYPRTSSLRQQWVVGDLHRIDMNFARLMQIVHEIECLSHAVAHGQQPVVSHDHAVGVAQILSDRHTEPLSSSIQHFRQRSVETLDSTPLRSRDIMKLRSILCFLAVVSTAGCSDSVRLEMDPDLLLVVSAKAGEATSESTLIIKNTGTELLKLGRFDYEIPEGYQLEWCAIDSASGKVMGPPLIAGFVKGRESFPAVVDIRSGMAIRLMLNWQSADKEPQDGQLVWQTNAPGTPVLTIPIKVQPR